MKIKRFSSIATTAAVIVASNIGMNAASLIAPVVQPVQAATCTDFSGRAMFQVNVRADKNTSSRVVKVLNVGPYQFSGYEMGQAVNDAWTNQPDSRWFKLSDRSGWVASAVINGNPPMGCSPSAVTKPSQGGKSVTDAVNRANPDVNYRFDGSWTYCNWFVADVLELLNVPVPRVTRTDQYSTYNSPVFGLRKKPLLAEDFYDYFNNGGGGRWRKVASAEAVTKANSGGVVVAVTKGKPGKDGHIAIVIPGGTGSNVQIAQAGLRNSKNMSIQDGFRDNPYLLFEYTGN